MYITLHCKDCENTHCNLCGKWLSEDDMRGCTRKVSEKEASEYQHYMEEVVPFFKLDRNISETYTRILSFLETLYFKPVGNLLNSRGKTAKF